MNVHDLLIEAIERAEEAGVAHDHNRVLVLIDQTNPRKRLTWTLAEARAQVAAVVN